MNKTKILAIVGPTASGKTELSIRLAKALDGEIICCDSMQIYKYMNIGTAKPTYEERQGVPHHLFDIVSLNDAFSCAEYKALAEKTVEDIVSRGKTPIFCGGTGLYLDSVLGSGFSPSVPEGIREVLQKRDVDDLYNELMTVDPKSAEGIHKNNVKRVVRALEIYHGTGKTKTEWDELSKEAPSKYDPLVFALGFKDREKLYDRINLRVDIMLNDGLIDEVKELYPSLGTTASQAIGYKELILYIEGKASYEDSVELLKKNTRNYAKRQLTYFKRNKDTLWFFRDDEPMDKIFEDIVNIAKDHLKNAN